ncbi:MAG: recombinase family protein [Clostridia bacterium]|nr:recombinase family protein [Clostridia bacterium]
MSRTSKYSVQRISGDTERVWKAGLYIRLSREDGDKIESESVSSQKALLERFVSENPEINLTEYYIDDGYSGTDFERPAFQRMISEAASKKINCVIVKDLSRFGRNYVEAGKYLEVVFPTFKLRFIAVNDGIDSFAQPSTMNNIIVPFKNIINDEYCRDISVKVRSALDIRRKQGKFIGSFAAYGYKKDESDHNKLVIDEEAAATVRFIYEKFLAGFSIIGVARALNARGVPNPSEYKAAKGLNCRRISTCKNGGAWTDSTVRRILTSEVYIGNLVQKKNEVISYKIHLSKQVDKSNRITVKGTHKPIISQQDFDKVQSLLRRDTRVSPNEKEGKLSVFAGFLKCADCGRAMQKRTVKQPNKTYEYYICSTYRKMHSSLCTKHAIRAEVLEEAVLTTLNKYIQLAVDFDRLLEKINRVQKGGARSKRLSAELSSNQKELERAQKILLDLYPDYKSGIIEREQYFALKEKYGNAVARAEREISRIKEEMRNFANGVDGSNPFVATFKKYGGLKELSRDVLIELVENIFVHEGGEVEIHLKCRDAFLAAEEYIGQHKTADKASSETA